MLISLSYHSVSYHFKLIMQIKYMPEMFASTYVINTYRSLKDSLEYIQQAHNQSKVAQKTYTQGKNVFYFLNN